MKKTDAPKHLSAEAKRLWARLHADFNLDDGAAVLLLGTLCEAVDRCTQARETIKVEGSIIADRFGQKRIHPAVTIERDARGQVLAAVRALRLAPEDVEGGR